MKCILVFLPLFLNFLVKADVLCPNSNTWCGIGQYCPDGSLCPILSTEDTTTTTITTMPRTIPTTSILCPNSENVWCISGQYCPDGSLCPTTSIEDTSKSIQTSSTTYSTTSSTNEQHTIMLWNNCTNTIYPAILGSTIPLNGGIQLNPQQIVNFTIPNGWSGRVWARTGCSFSSNGFFSCLTGDCGSGQVACNGAGGSPTSLAEFTFNAWAQQDFYDVSLVDAYNIELSIIPSNPSCLVPSCNYDLLSTCPSELLSNNNMLCLSACSKFNEDIYCCRGDYNTPETCDLDKWPINYSQIFKQACPTQYSYAYDDKTSTFTCPSLYNNIQSSYIVKFC